MSRAMKFWTTLLPSRHNMDDMLRGRALFADRKLAEQELSATNPTLYEVTYEPVAYITINSVDKPNSSR